MPIALEQRMRKYILYNGMNGECTLVQGVLREDGSAAVIWGENHLKLNHATYLLSKNLSDQKIYKICSIEKDPRKDHLLNQTKPYLILLKGVKEYSHHIEDAA